MSGLPPPGIAPLGQRRAGVGIEHTDAALVPVRDVELRRVAREVEPVRTHTGGDLPDDLRRGPVEHPHTVLVAVGDVEHRAVGRQLDVLRTHRRVPVRHVDHAQQPVRGDVDHGDPAGELTGEHRRPPVRSEVGVVDARAVRSGQRVLHRPRVRVVEHQLAVRLRDGHSRAPVRGEVQVVRVRHRDRRPGGTGGRIEGGQLVAEVVAGVERAHVPRRDHVLQLPAERVAGHHGERGRVDHPDVVGLRVRDVDQRPGRPSRGRQQPGPCGRVHVVRVGHRGHAGQHAFSRRRRGGRRDLLVPARPAPRAREWAESTPPAAPGRCGDVAATMPPTVDRPDTTSPFTQTASRR